MRSIKPGKTTGELNGVRCQPDLVAGNLATFLTRTVGRTLPYAEWLAVHLERMFRIPEQPITPDLPLVGLALRSLALANPERHAALETHLGGAPMLRLIRANGTIFELFRILQYSTPGFAAGLIDALDALAVAALIDKTIAEGRSIGTLDLALRELAERAMPDGRSQLEALEAHLGGAPMLRLIRANGTIFELFRILQYSTPDFAAGLIDALDAPAVAALIDKTIAEGRSIGTLDLALRELAERAMPDGRSQLEALEVHLGGAPMLRLIRANGTICELFNILRRSTRGFAAGLIDALDAPAVAALIDKTIGEGRSIGTLSFAFRELRQELPGHLPKLERYVGADGLWRLLLGAGDLNDCAWLLDGATGSFRAEVLSAQHAQTSAIWADLTRRGGFYAVARFGRDSLALLPKDVRARFEEGCAEALTEAVESSSWPDLGTGLAAAQQIADSRMRETLENAAFARLDRQKLDELRCDSFIDAANAAYWLRLRRESLRPELASRLWTILPDRRLWPEDYTLFIGGGLLLESAAAEPFPPTDGERLLRAFCHLPATVKIEKTSPEVLDRFIRSLFSVWRARGRSLAQRLDDLQSAEFWKRVESVVAANAGKPARNDDKLKLLALSGLLTFVLSARTKRLSQALQGRLKGAFYLVDEAERLPFISAVLALKGLSLVDPYQARFSADRRQRLLVKVGRETTHAPLVDLLRTWLQRDDRFHQPRRY